MNTTALSQTDLSKLVEIMKQHIELKEVIRKKEKELNADIYSKQGLAVACLADFKTSPEIQSLYKKDHDLFTSLKYEEVALIEAAMLIGREIFLYQRNGSSSIYDEELGQPNIKDLKSWAQIFDVPLTESEGGNKDLALEYTLGKRHEFIKAYLDAMKGAGSDDANE